jgi:uncharacterized small protein (DUF1192 family)
MKLTPCCNAEYGEYGSMSHSFVACSKCGKSEFSEEIERLKIELANAKALNRELMALTDKELLTKISSLIEEIERLKADLKAGGEQWGKDMTFYSQRVVDLKAELALRTSERDINTDNVQKYGREISRLRAELATNERAYEIGQEVAIEQQGKICKLTEELAMAREEMGRIGNMHKESLGQLQDANTELAVIREDHKCENTDCSNIIDGN